MSLDPALEQQEIVQEIADRPTTVNFAMKDVESRSADFPTSTCEESEYYLFQHVRWEFFYTIICSITPKMYHHHYVAKPTPT
jgi:hypothetical protein